MMLMIMKQSVRSLSVWSVLAGRVAGLEDVAEIGRAKKTTEAMRGRKVFEGAVAETLVNPEWRAECLLGVQGIRVCAWKKRLEWLF
jgi:hypothetical protein